MRTTVILAMALFCLISCSESEHQSLDHNFTIQRLIILNDNNEVLMMREKSVWATPSLLYSKRQFLKEGIDSLANAYGVQIKNLELRGKFSYKYDYQPYATLRDYFVADYSSGQVKIPKGMDDAKWMPLDEAIEQNTVTSIKQITRQIMQYPDVIWGGSFMVSHVGDDHPTKMVEPFYPLSK